MIKFEDNIEEVEENEIISLAMSSYNIPRYHAKALYVIYKLRKVEARVISNLVQIPRCRVYDVCDDLKRLGLIRLIPKHKEKVRYKVGCKEREITIPITYEALSTLELDKLMKDKINRIANKKIELTLKINKRIGDLNNGSIL